MAFDFSIFNDASRTGVVLDESFVEWLIKEQSMDQILYYEKLWAYYRNELREGSVGGVGGERGDSGRPYRQAQEYGLPGRITGVRHSFYGGMFHGEALPGIKRKEVVIENDIGWRVDTLVDFLFGKPFRLVSKAEDLGRAEEIEKILESVFDSNGGMSYFQELALLGSVYGFVDVILRLDEKCLGQLDGSVDSAGSGPKALSDVLEIARRFKLEAIEAPRSLPILDENDCQEMRYYVQHYWQLHNQLSDEEDIVRTMNQRGERSSRQLETHHVEVIGKDYWQRYSDDELVSEGVNPLGVIPVVHIQNMAIPYRYEGQSDVEPLMSIQDELNTRLSDRASRVTFQSFKMYLGKGIEGFDDRSIGPGVMWSTENTEASIEEFGGDGGNASEEAHLKSIREAMEKISGVGSVAAGILTGKVGNLTSAVALEVTLMGLLSKTERKRRAYEKGIREICRLILLALDKTGVYPSQPAERDVEIRWPNPLPENRMEKLQEGKLKKELGVPEDQILSELGYRIG